MTFAAAWNQAGGLRYHARALRRRTTAWGEFRSSLATWLDDWQPASRSLALVGPSGGYCLPVPWLARFERLIVFEPDPLARWILARRLTRELHREPFITWIRVDLWIDPLLRGGCVPDALLRDDTALLFSNFVGQLPFLVEPERWPQFLAAWREHVWPLLERTPWASFHDRVSGAERPQLSDSVPSGRLDDPQVTQLYEAAAAGRTIELLDHCSSELLPEGASYKYLDWPLTADTHHLIECVIGRERA